MSNCVDDNILQELTEIMGEELNLLLKTFLQDSELKIALLSTHLKAGDSEALRRVAHSIKGSSRNVGALMVAEKCEILEFSARNHNLQHGNQEISNVEDAFNLVKAEFISRFPESY